MSQIALSESEKALILVGLKKVKEEFSVISQVNTEMLIGVLKHLVGDEVDFGIGEGGFEAKIDEIIAKIKQ